MQSQSENPSPVTFSETFDQLVPAGQAWLKHFLQPPNEKAMSAARLEEFYKERDLQPGCVWPDFEWMLVADGTLWIRGGGGRNLQNAVTVLQRYLREFEPNRAFSITWSTVCRPRSQEFGGGAVFITAEYTEWEDVWDWVDHQFSEWEARKETQAHRKLSKRLKSKL